MVEVFLFSVYSNYICIHTKQKKPQPFKMYVENFVNQVQAD